MSWLDGSNIKYLIFEILQILHEKIFSDDMKCLREACNGEEDMTSLWERSGLVVDKGQII